MSIPPRPNPPWSPYEKLELMTEIVKALNLPPGDLLPLVRSHGEPRWDNMALPAGRTLGQCKAMYREFVLGQPPLLPTNPVTMRAPQGPSDTRPPQTMYMPEGSTTPTLAINPRYPEIQPRPPNFPGAGGMMPTSNEPPKKKRGRPTKAESEQRKEAAKMRGESVSAVRRDTVHAQSVHAPQSVAAQAAQAVMAPAPIHTPMVSPDPAINRKRPLPGESMEHLSRAPGTEEDQPGPSRPPTSAGSSRTPQRDYPQILSQDATGATSSFRAPRGGE